MKYKAHTQRAEEEKPLRVADAITELNSQKKKKKTKTCKFISCLLCPSLSRDLGDTKI